MATKRKRKLLWHPDDDAANFAYPQALLASAERQSLPSPTKRQKKAQKGKRRPSTQSNRSTAKATALQTNPSDQTSILGESREGEEDGGGFDHADLVESYGKEGDRNLTADSHGPGTLELYIDAVASGVAGFKHLHSKFCVVQGWDYQRCQANNHWHHLQFEIIDGAATTACTCPAATRQECVHQEYFRELKIWEQVSVQGLGENPRGTPAILFSQREFSTTAFETLFSVDSTSSAALKGRAIVRHVGNARERGTWTCTKCPSSVNCSHVNHSKMLLPEEFGDRLEHVQLADDEVSVDITSLSRGPGTTVSYLPTMPPKWALIPSDVMLYPYPVPIREPGNYSFRLTPESSCLCHLGEGGRTMFDPDSPSTLRKCKLYTLTTVIEVEMEIQRCPRCPPSRRRYIGPDLRELGIFNYNNSILVTHELLDSYTSCYTTSETPFCAWVIQTARVYENVDAVFMGQDLFRSVWFSFAYIQNFVGDMVCDECQECPDTAIFDGITLAFGKKHLQDTLRPPTITHPESLKRPNVKYFPAQQLLLSKTLRSQVRSALDGPPIANLLAAAAPPTPSQSTPTPSVTQEHGSLYPPFPFAGPNSTPSTPTRPQAGRGIASAASPLTPTSSPSKAVLRQINLVEQHLSVLRSASAGLRIECPAVALLFDTFLGPSAYARRRRCPALWRSFFKQIAAEESVVQMVNWTAWQGLVRVIQDGLSPETRGHLLSVPVLFRAFDDPSCSKAALREIIIWIEQRTRAVFKGLLVDPGELPDASPDSLSALDDWRKTGTFYSLPVRRHRPIYPKIRGDGQKDQKAQQEELKGEGCRKYYEQYVQRGLTGGIMVAWCTHSICYGFHCIPSSEGRDDVFSALVTRWPRAPKRVIYDYACALGPYCMLREPQFFANTFFHVDHFHASGHVKCSPAASFSEYVNVDPSLANTNSSAAECANSGLKRIRKSTSYMTQERAIIYTKVFLSIWNRGKKLRMSREMARLAARA